MDQQGPGGAPWGFHIYTRSPFRRTRNITRKSRSLCSGELFCMLTRALFPVVQDAQHHAQEHLQAAQASISALTKEEEEEEGLFKAVFCFFLHGTKIIKKLHGTKIIRAIIHNESDSLFMLHEPSFCASTFTAHLPLPLALKPQLLCCPCCRLPLALRSNLCPCHYTEKYDEYFITIQLMLFIGSAKCSNIP